MSRLTRRQAIAGFVTTAAGLLMPEPRRVYSFLWSRPKSSILADLEKACRATMFPHRQFLVMSPNQARTWARAWPPFKAELIRSGLGALCD